MEKGSVLILTIITVLIFSIMVAGLLTIGTTEIKTTQNYVLKKKSFYKALQGLETVIEDIKNAEDPIDIQANKAALSSSNDSTKGNYSTGDNTKVAPVSKFDEFLTPQLTGISLSTESGFVPVIYRVPIVAEVAAGTKAPAVTEIEAGVLALLKNN